MVRDHPAIWQVDVSTSNFDLYGDSARCEADVVGAAAGYLPKVAERLRKLDTAGVDFALCLYFAGMDPHEGCSFGGRAGITANVLAERERLVFEWAASRRLPVAFALGGGYAGPALSRESLVGLHRLTAAAAAGHRVGPG
jgi:acetoin utilization deacetylase AcuC-like enzyme